jgi:lambda repressor-like predicted transcriptional regulator
MIGGKMYFQETTPEPPRHREHDATSRTEAILTAVKASGEITLGDLSRRMGISVHNLRNAINNATCVTGSRIYEDKIDGKVVLGWLK